MSKERYNQIIDEVYENYQKEMLYHPEENWLDNGVGEKSYRQLTQEEFINKCKTDNEFSERWGLEIEERELSWENRRDLLTPNQYDGTSLNKYGKEDCGFGYISPFTDKMIHYWLDLHNIPTKLITLIYNKETIESYE